MTPINAVTGNAAPPVHRRLTRRDAAMLLRVARNAFRNSPDQAGEAIGWALCAMRESIHVRRLKIDFLLHIENHDSADALIARCLMQGHDEPTMRLRFARSLFAQGRVEQAEREVHLVMGKRPDHAGAHALAGQIAAAQGRLRRAVVLLNRACALRPQVHGHREMLVQAMLNAGMSEFAAAQCAAFHGISNLLRARTLRAQGRTLDAIELLERAIAADGTQDAKSCEECLCELIDLLDQLGDRPRLLAIVPQCSAGHPAAIVRAARALLTFGDIDNLQTLAACIASHDRCGRSADELRMMALCFGSEAIPVSHISSPENAAMRADRASLWLRGLLGRMISNRLDSREIGSDPSTSVLQPMIHAALRSIDAAIAEDEQRNGDDAMLLRHRESCLHAIGRAHRADDRTREVAGHDEAGEQPIEQSHASRRAA